MKGVVALAVAVMMSPLALADSKPGADHKPMSSIVKDLEKKGFVVVEADFDGDHFDVEAYNKAGERREIVVNSRSGEVISDKKD